MPRPPGPTDGASPRKKDEKVPGRLEVGRPVPAIGPLGRADCCNAKARGARPARGTTCAPCPSPTAGWREVGTETTDMNVQLVNPAAPIAMLIGSHGGDGRDEGLWRKVRARVGEEV